MGETIEKRGCQLLVGEHMDRFAGGEVGGKHRGATLDLDFSVEITVTAPDIAVTIAGTISQDGSEGNLSMNSDSTTTTYAWAPATDPNYDWRFVSTITGFDPQVERFVTEKLTVETISSGGFGEFSYVRDEGNQNELTNSGVWGQ